MKKIILPLFLTIFLFGCQKSNEPEISISSESSSIVESSSVIDIDFESVDKVTEALKTGFGAITNISFSEDNLTFHLTPIAGINETETLIKIAANPKAKGHQDALKTMALSCVEFSQLISENVGKGYSIQLDNPENDEKPFFIVRDGNVEYPIMN